MSACGSGGVVANPFLWKNNSATIHASVAHVCKHNLISLVSSKYILYSIFTAPAACLTKNRSFSLTSHQLRALTQLACTLMGFERTVRKLVMNMTFVDFTSETPSIKGTVYPFFYIKCNYNKLFNLIAEVTFENVKSC